MFDTPNIPATALTALLANPSAFCPVTTGYATVSEYAQAAGSDVAEALDEFANLIAANRVSLEPYGDAVFVHTAPLGRHGMASVYPANLWERLRDRLDVAQAHAAWRLVRLLEEAGWATETRPTFVVYGLGPITNPPFLGVYVGNVVAPLLAYPDPAFLASDASPYSDLWRAGTQVAAVTCGSGELDEMIGVTRRWMLTRDVLPDMNVLILEEPSYNPVVLRPGDGSVTPVTVDIPTVAETLGH